LADSGNLWAKRQLHVNKSGNQNFKALLSKPCLHAIELPDGSLLSVALDTVATKNGKFTVLEQLCPKCAKTLALAVVKGGV